MKNNSKSKNLKKSETKKETSKEASTKKPTELLDTVEVATIEAPFLLSTLTMKEMRWTAKLSVRTLLPRSYHRYKVILQLDEQPWLDRIDDYEKELDDSLFKNEKTSKKEVSKRVAEQRAALDQTREQCEKIEFSAIVDALRYKDNDTTLELRIPDDVVEPMNRQKVRLPLYKISLTPLF